MHSVRIGVAAFLLVSVLIGLIRVVRCPAPAERMLALQLFGSTAVGVLLLLAEDPGRAALRDVALVFALLAAITLVSFVRLVPDQGNERRS